MHVVHTSLTDCQKNVPAFQCESGQFNTCKHWCWCIWGTIKRYLTLIILYSTFPFYLVALFSFWGNALLWSPPSSCPAHPPSVAPPLLPWSVCIKCYDCTHNDCPSSGEIGETSSKLANMVITFYKTVSNINIR